MELRKFRFASYNEAKAALFPQLRTRVFHATSHTGFAGIQRDGYIGSNKDKRYPCAYPQAENSFFRKRGYVSLIDLRTATDEQIEDGDMKYRYLSPSSEQTILLFLKPDCYDQLVTWDVSKAEEGLRAMIVPYVESGFPDAIPVSCIEEAWEVTITQPPLNSFDALIASLDEPKELPK